MAELDEQNITPETTGGFNQTPPTGEPTLSQADRSKLDSIVMSMAKKNASKEQVQAIVSDFKTKYAKVQPSPVKTQAVPTKSPSGSAVGRSPLNDTGESTIDVSGLKDKRTLIQSMQEKAISKPKAGKEQKTSTKFDQRVNKVATQPPVKWNSKKPIDQKVKEVFSANPNKVQEGEQSLVGNSVDNYIERHTPEYKYMSTAYDTLNAQEDAKAQKDFMGLEDIGVNQQDFNMFLKNKTSYFNSDINYDSDAQKEYALNSYVNKYMVDRASYLKDKFTISNPEGRQRIIDESSTLGKNYENFKKENLPEYYKVEQQKKAEDLQFYKDVKAGKNILADAAGVSKGLIKGATYALADLVSTGADIIGFDNYADKLRFEKGFIDWIDNRGTVTNATGKKVKYNGNEYLVTADGNVIDTQTKTSVNNITKADDLNNIYKMSEESKDTDHIYSGRGYSYALSNTLGNLAFQIVATKGIGGAAAKVGITEANLGRLGATIPEMVAVGSMVGSSTYNDTLQQLRDAGVKDEEAKIEAGKVAAITSAAGAIATRFLPNTNANKLLSELNTGDVIRRSVAAFAESGSKGVSDFLKSGAKNVFSTASHTFEEGAKEMLQEFIEGAGQKQGNYWANANLDKDILSTGYTRQEILDTAILSFAAGGLAAAGGSMRSGSLGTNIQENFDMLTAIDGNKFDQAGETLINKGHLTEDQFIDLKQQVKNYKDFKNKLPDSVKGKTAVDVSQLLAEREGLKRDKKNLDEAFHPEIDSKLENVNNRIVETLNNKVNEETTTETTTGLDEDQTSAESEATNRETTYGKEVKRPLNDAELIDAVENNKPLFKDPKLVNYLKSEFNISDELINALPPDLNVTFSALMGRKGDSPIGRVLTSVIASGGYRVPREMSADNDTGVINTTSGLGDIQMNLSHMIIGSVFGDQTAGGKTLFHEIVHAGSVLTMADIREYIKNPEYQKSNKYTPEQIKAYENISDVYRTMKRKEKNLSKPTSLKASTYGLTNEYEFVAEFMSNKNFREWIVDDNNILDPNSSMLSKIWESIKTMLGIKNKKVNTEFESQIQSDIDSIFKAHRENLNKIIKSRQGNVDTNTDTNTTVNDDVSQEVTSTPETQDDLRKTDLSNQTGLDSFIDRVTKMRDDLDNNNDTLYKRLPVDVARGALNAVIAAANTAKLGLDAISAGVDYIRSTDWYKNLDVNEREELENDGVWDSILSTTNEPNVDKTNKVSIPEGKLLTDKLEALRQGYEQGSADVSKLKADFLEQVKSAIKGLGTNFSERDAGILLDQASKVNKDNIGGVNKTIDNLVKRLEKRAGKARDNKLKTLQKRANVKARTKYGNAGENVRKLTTLPVNQIPDANYDEYYSIMEDLSKGNDVDFNHVNDLYDRLRQNINDYVEKKNEDKANKVKPVPKDNAEAINKLQSFDRDNIKPSDNLTDFERKTLRDFKAIPNGYLNSLSAAELGRINRALEAHRDAGILPNKVLTDVVNKYKAERTAKDIINTVGAKVLKPVSGITKFIDNLKGREYTSDDFFKKISREMMQHIDYAVKGVKGTTFYDNIVHPLTSNLNKADNETMSVANEFTNLFNRAAKKEPFKLNVKLQMFLRAREFDSNPELRGNKVYPLAEHMKAMEANKLNLNMPQTDINYVQEVYNDVKGKTSEEMYNDFSPAEKSVIEFMDKKLRETELTSRDYNNHLRGETLLYPTNYFPRKNSGNNINADTDADIKNRLTNILGATSVKADQSNERIATGANPLSFDTSGIFMGHIRQSNIEANLAQPLKVVGMTISNVKKSNNASLVSLGGALEKTVSNLIDAQLGSSPYSFKSRSNELFNTFVRNTFTKVLVDPVRLGYDVLSNYSTVYGLHADKLPAIIKANNNIDDSVNKVIQENIASTQSERLGGSRASDYKGAMSSPINQVKYRTLRPEPVQRMVDMYKHNVFTKFSEEAGKQYYKYADYPSQHLWKYYTNEEFKKITGNDFDGKKYRDDKSYREEVHNDLQKAVTQADKKTANYFNTGATAEQKLIVQSGKANWFTKFNNFLRSFTFNENRVFWDSLNGMTGIGDSTFDSKSDAFRAFAVVNARGIAYSYLGAIAGDWIVKMVTGADDEEEGLVNNKAMKKALGQHLGLIALGNKGAVAGFMGNFIGEMINKEYIKSTGEKYNAFEDSMFFTPTKKSKYTDFLGNLGAEGLAVKSVVDFGSMSYDLLDKYRANDKITEKDLIKFKTAQYTTSLVSQATGLPIDRFGRVTQKYLQAKNPVTDKPKKHKSKIKTSYSGYGSGYYK